MRVQLVIVDHELRFTPAFLRGRDHLRRGSIGTVLVVEANVLFPVPTGNFTWWADASMGGGVLGAIGSHIIDALRCFRASLIKTFLAQSSDTQSDAHYL